MLWAMNLGNALQTYMQFLSRLSYGAERLPRHVYFDNIVQFPERRPREPEEFRANAYQAGFYTSDHI